MARLKKLSDWVEVLMIVIDADHVHHAGVDLHPLDADVTAAIVTVIVTEIAREKETGTEREEVTADQEAEIATVTGKEVEVVIANGEVAVETKTVIGRGRGAGIVGGDPSLVTKNGNDRDLDPVTVKEIRREVGADQLIENVKKKIGRVRRRKMKTKRCYVRNS